MRQRTLEFVVRNPGASLQEIADHLGVARNAATHHVRVLQNRGQLVVQRLGRRRLHFEASVQCSFAQRMWGLVRHQRIDALLHLYRREPTLPWRAAARAMGVTPRAVKEQMHRLARENIVTISKERPGGPHRVSIIAPALAALVAPRKGAA